MGKKNKKFNKKQDQSPKKVENGVAEQSKPAFKKNKNKGKPQNDQKGKQQKQPPKPTTNGVPKQQTQAVNKPKHDKKKKLDNKPPEVKKDNAKPKKDKAGKPKAGEQATKQPVESPLVLKKRQKNRIKSEIKKNLAMDSPKSTTNVADNYKLLEKKLLWLTAKPEPRSVKAERKIALIQKMLDKVNKDKKAKHLTKKERKAKETVAEAVKQEPTPAGEGVKNNPFVVFVGNLHGDVTKEMLMEQFKSIGKIEKIRIPKSKKKSRQFAYVQVENEAARQKLLVMHGTVINGKAINVLYADKKKGKNKLQSENAKLQAKRKLATVTNTQMIQIGKELKKKKKPK